MKMLLTILIFIMLFFPVLVIGQEAEEVSTGDPIVEQDPVEEVAPHDSTPPSETTESSEEED